ncbi:MAG: tetraacyldisaccharide 4'-kinase [Gammaproteobacteria bacterium (ex Lamellibrachia satsuma)]|nr:MAG: tetraacyldisaccharide 4'-kinase [Gammaproteobacteria bacterium (ex Lamellibrachia satsuma)]
MKSIDHYWEGWNPVSLILLPFSLLFCLLSWLRRIAYRTGLLSRERISVPVIIIGNITVGGTGKTPLVIWLAEWLKGRGLQPGIITRGYGGKADSWPREVTVDSSASEVGDEAVLLARRSGCPVFAGPNRPDVARALLAAHPCDLILSDDGLQHYALQRDAEIVVIDGKRGFGNGLCLPAGPLRERQFRLNQVDLLVVNGEKPLRHDAFQMRVEGEKARLLADNEQQRSLSEFTGQPIEAVAAIGNPERFFSMLEAAGLRINRHPFPDHHPFVEEDLLPLQKKTVLMTEKDAVKCTPFAGKSLWYVPADARLDDGFIQQLTQIINRLCNG